MLRRIVCSIALVIDVILSIIFKDTLNANLLWFIPVAFLGLYIVVMALFFILLYLYSLFFSFKKEYQTCPKIYYDIFAMVVEYIISVSGEKVHVTGLEKVDLNQKFMVVFNHKSRFDPMTINYVLKNYRIVHISKPSNFKAPIAGRFMYRTGYLAINRENDREAIKTILKAVDYIKEDRLSVGAAPEGTRNKGDGLLPFKPGLFKIATRSKCPIVVATLTNTENIHKNFPFKKTIVDCHILEVIPYEKYQDWNTTEIAKYVRGLMTTDLGIVEEEKEEKEND